MTKKIAMSKSKTSKQPRNAYCSLFCAARSSRVTERSRPVRFICSRYSPKLSEGLMGPRKQSHARHAQTNACPAQPVRCGKSESSETAALKPEIQNERAEQKMEHVSDDVRPQALALASTALGRQSFARSPDTKSKPKPHQKHQDKQRPENGVKCFFGIHTNIRAWTNASEAAFKVKVQPRRA